MNIVGQNLVESEKQYVNCSVTNIPDKTDYGYSICYQQKNNNNIVGPQYSFDRKYIETLYKSIFGKDAKLDTSVAIWTSHGALHSYSYVESEDAYVLFGNDGGYTTGPGGYLASLESAVKDENKIYIYESVKKEIYNGDSVLEKTENFKMIYTFELEDDGMYKFVSRVKEDK